MKVGHKTRRGRKRKPKGHGQHRNGRAIIDPINRRAAVEARQARRGLLDPDEEAARTLRYGYPLDGGERV